MSDFERILLECRYLLSLNKTYQELAFIFDVDVKIVWDDLNNKLPKFDKLLYKRVRNVLNINNNP